MKFDILKIASYLPTVEGFKFGLSFREKLKWISIFLAIYFFLLNVPLIGIKPIYQAQNPLTILYSTLTGAKIGTIATLGISPLLTSSIVVQLLVASKIINWDMKNEEDRKKIKALESILTYIFLFVESVAFTYSLPSLIPIESGFEILVAVQIFIGGFLAYMLSIALDKTKFGSGLTLIILSGIVFSLFINLFSPFTISRDGRYILWFQEENAYPIGKFLSLFISLFKNDLDIFLTSFFTILSTIMIILIAIILVRSGIEIPITLSGFRGFGRPLELSLFYTSTLPLIFGSAFLATLNMFFLGAATTVTGDLRCGIFGCFDKNNIPISGIAYYLSFPRWTILSFFGLESLFGEVDFNREILKTIIFFVFFVSVLTLFSWIWVYSSGMDPQSIAESLSFYGFGISGFRSDEKTLENILNKYIPYLTILSGVLSAVLAIMTDIFGSVIHSTSLIILVSASYSYYTLVKNEKNEDIPRLIKEFLE